MIHELEDRHLGGVAPTAVGLLEHAGVTTGARLVTLGQGREELGHYFVIAGAVESQTARGRRAGLAQGDEAVDHATDFLRLLHSGFNLFLMEHAVGHIAKHGDPVRGIAAELAAVHIVSHKYSLTLKKGPTQSAPGKLSILEVAVLVELAALLAIVHDAALVHVGVGRLGRLRRRHETIELHAQAQAHLTKDVLDLVERLAAEVLGLEHLGFGLLNKLVDVLDVGVLKAVGRAYLR
jgi:hypothetical protein